MNNSSRLLSQILSLFVLSFIASPVAFAAAERCEAAFNARPSAASVSNTASPVQAPDLPRWTELVSRSLKLAHGAGITEAAVFDKTLKKVEGILQAEPALLLSLLAKSQDPAGRDALLAQLDAKDPFLGLTSAGPSAVMARQWVKGRLTYENLEQLQNLNKTSFFSGTKYRKLSTQPLRIEKAGIKSLELEALKENPYLQVQSAETEAGTSNVTLTLPDARNATDAQIQLASRISPELSPVLIAARSNQGASISEKIQARFLEALTRERIQRLNSEISSGSQSQAALFQSVASFVRDISLVQPYDDPAGVLSHHLAHVLLLNLDLPPPRSRAVIDRLVFSPSVQAGPLLREASLLTSRLLEDASVRESQGLKVLNSAWCYLPSELEPVQIQIKHQGNAKSFGTKEFSLEPEQWLAFVRTTLSVDPSLRAQLGSHPEATLLDSVTAFREFSAKNNVEFHHDKEGIRDIGLRFADADFIDKLFQLKALDATAWQSAMNRWYQPEVIWRGHGYRDNPISEGDIVTMFKTADMQLAANPVISAGRVGHDIKHLGVQEIIRYNNSLLDGKVFEVSDDHHKMGTGYQASYGFSTSKSYDVARAFALGAMKVAEYGKQDAAQDRVKTRLAVGIRRARHYIEMGRLKPLNADFSYIYGRQQEVMGIGIADPDSVVIAKELNADKSVLKTYFRSEHSPLEVMIIRGDYVLGEPIPGERVEKIVNLQTGAERAYPHEGQVLPAETVTEHITSAEAGAVSAPETSAHAPTVVETPTVVLPVATGQPAEPAVTSASAQETRSIPTAEPGFVSKLKKLFRF